MSRTVRLAPDRPFNSAHIIVRENGTYKIDDGVGRVVLSAAEMIVVVKQVGEVKELLAALEAVEWADQSCWGDFCPWCNNKQAEGHKPDCQRQAAITQAKGEG